MAKYKTYSYKGYKIKERPDGAFDIFKPEWDPHDPIFEEIDSIEVAKAWINSDIEADEGGLEEIDECDGAGGGDVGGGSISGGGSAFGIGSSAIYDAPAFGKAGNSIIKKKPYTITMGESEIKENIIRPIVEKYIEKYL